MKANVGTVDRIVRLVLGLALAAWGWLGGLASPWNWVAIGVGVVLVLTAAIRFCPLYAPFGLSTCERKGD